MPKWISVENSLPTEGVDVLVCIDTGEGDLDWRLAMMHRYQHWCWRGVGDELHDDGYESMGERVTHWAEIINLPNGKGFA